MIYNIRIVRGDVCASLGDNNIMNGQPWKMQIQRVWFKYDGENFECGLHPWEDVPVVLYEDLPQDPAPGGGPAPDPAPTGSCTPR